MGDVEFSNYLKTLDDIYELMDHLFLEPDANGHEYAQDYKERQLRRLWEMKQKLIYLSWLGRTRYSQNWEIPNIVSDRQGEA